MSLEVKQTSISGSRNRCAIDLTPMKNAPPIASAIMVLQEANRSRSNRKRAVAIGLVSLSIALLMVGIAAHILLTSPSSIPHASEMMPPAAAIATPLPVAEPLPRTLDEPSEREKGDRPSALLSPSPSPAPRIVRSERIKRARKKSVASASPAKEPAPAASAAETPKKPTTIEDLIRMAAPDLVPPPSAPVKPSPQLPKRLTRRQIVGVMNGVGAKIRKCFDRFKVPGVADLRFRIMPDGKMGDVEIRGIFSGTPTGVCVLRAAEGATFPKHSGLPMKIKYPFVLRLR